MNDQERTAGAEARIIFAPYGTTKVVPFPFVMAEQFFAGDELCVPSLVGEECSDEDLFILRP